MINKSFYLSSILALMFFLSFIRIGYSQPTFERSYELCLTNLPLQDFTFIFTQRLNDKNYLEISNSFVFSKTKESDASPIVFYQNLDPYRLYNLYRFRIGNRWHFAENNNYICPMLIFNFGRFTNATITHYIDATGDAYDEDWTLNRTRYDIGAILKFGHVKTYENRFLRDIYWGVGFKLKYFYDDILKKTGFYGTIIQYDDPLQQEYVKFTPTFHLGILVGYLE